MTAPLHRVRNYEELEGAQGREVFFRPHRYRASDLAPLVANVYVRRDGGDPVPCALVDISQNGVAFEWTQERDLAPGDSLADLAVGFDEHVAYRGEAKVGSVRDANGTLVVGVSFVDQLIDIDEVLQLKAIRSWTGRDGRGLSAAARPWSVPGCSEFKAMVADLALYFEDEQKQMAELESQLSWQVVQGETMTPARSALIDRVKKEFAAEVVRASEAIDEVLRAVPASHRKGLQEFSLRQVDRYYMQAPWMIRARTKPFGYPGDYEVMRFFYERNFEGPTLFAKSIGYATIQTKAAQAVRYRKDLIKRQLREFLHARAGTQPVRILSVAAGPAQELYDLFMECDDLPCPVEIVLFDQDKGALSYAFRRLKPLAEQKFPGKVHLLYLHESIKRLLKDSEMFTAFGKFDFIFSCGLFDYLQMTTAAVLTRNLHARLAEGGQLYVGNMQPANPSRWIMEHHLEWHLVYRTRAELMEVGHRAVPEASMQILEEETGVNPFILLTKG